MKQYKRKKLISPADFAADVIAVSWVFMEYDALSSMVKSGRQHKIYRKSIGYSSSNNHNE